MAMQQTIATSSSSSSKNFDVFISFRGEDTRRQFTSHLYVALSKYFRTFIDEKELEKGDEISLTLIKAIEEAYVSVVVFSENYASSKWCLNELVKILECKKEQGQIVIPVFYEIDPSNVRNQVGSYGQAFEKHEQDLRQSKDKLQKWRNALTEAANLSGWDSQNYRIESDFIKDIVQDVWSQLNHRHPFEDNKELVGIKKKYEKVEWLMKTGSNDVKTLVFWGMGGIGKTTLAEYLFAKWSYQYERCCLLKNVREYSTRRELNIVRKELFSKLLELPPDAPYVETPRRLACKRSLIVLDDVATLEQAENLNIVNNSLGPGSRVIVTTRDKQICSQFNECTIYEVKPLIKDDSLELFCLHAFQQKHAEVGYEELSERAIGYCRGNPLALKVLGANFRTKSKQVWESELEKLKKIPNRTIHDVLKLSFDDLDRSQRDIFLDIVCFCSSGITNFDPRERDYLIVLFNACDFSTVSEIEVLLRKALIAVNSLHTIEMHGLLVEMGREIVKQESQESPKDPGRRSRLWNSEDVYELLKDNKGTEDVEVIWFDISNIEDLYLSSASFKRMVNLRFLHITSYTHRRVVHLLHGLERLSDKLRHLYWDLFPLESLPSAFCAERLVTLSIRHSKLKKLWDGIQKLDNLMTLDLCGSRDLIEIPDLSRAPNLQIVRLDYCESLCQLHPSVFTCPKLRKLQLNCCQKIKSLKANIHSKSFQTLDLFNCSSLVEFSVISEEMMFLSLQGTAIHEIPSSIWRNSKLISLNLRDCKNLNIVRKKLSTDLGLSSLTSLILEGCTEINTSNLWFILDGMPSLGELDLSKCCNLETLPDNIQNNSLLNILNLDKCSKIKSLPKLPTSLKQLTAINCTYLDTSMLHFNKMNSLSDIYFPGGQVPYEFDFHTTKASIDIPPIPKSGLCGFIFCILLSKGLIFNPQRVACTIYEHGKEILDLKELFETYFRKAAEPETLILDHVLLCSWSGGNCKLVNMGNESDHYNLSFEFKYYVPDDKKQWSTKGIKGCGVFPVYGLEDWFGLECRLDGRSSSRDESVEDESDIDGWMGLLLDDRSSSRDESVELQFTFSAQVSDESDQHLKFDTDELQHQAIRAEVGGSSNNNEDDRQQLLIPPKKRKRT